MKIKILTHTKGFQEADIPDDFALLRVTLMTGDEIIEVYRHDPRWGDPYLYETLDPGKDNRTRDFLDATYIVSPDNIEKWNTRKDSYHIWQKEFFRITFEGFYKHYWY